VYIHGDVLLWRVTSAVAARASVITAGRHAVSASRLAQYVSTKINGLTTPSSSQSSTPDVPSWLANNRYQLRRSKCTYHRPVR
jgi:ectoine hydroxylase-related dioxygenase (phytanoyl-CoA dioxygenase family)